MHDKVEYFRRLLHTLIRVQGEVGLAMHEFLSKPRLKNIGVLVYNRQPLSLSVDTCLSVWTPVGIYLCVCLYILSYSRGTFLSGCWFSNPPRKVRVFWTCGVRRRRFCRVVPLFFLIWAQMYHHVALSTRLRAFVCRERLRVL